MKKILSITLAFIMIITFALVVSDALFGTAFAKVVGIEVVQKEKTPEEEPGDVYYTINFTYRETNNPDLESLIYSIKLMQNTAIPFEDYNLDIPDYVFKGWHTAGAGAWDPVSDNETATADITYYAIYEKIPIEYVTVLFKIYGSGLGIYIDFEKDTLVDSSLIVEKIKSHPLIMEQTDSNDVLYSVSIREDDSFSYDGMGDIKSFYASENKRYYIYLNFKNIDFDYVFYVDENNRHNENSISFNFKTNNFNDIYALIRDAGPYGWLSVRYEYSYYYLYGIDYDSNNYLNQFNGKGYYYITVLHLGWH